MEMVREFLEKQFKAIEDRLFERLMEEVEKRIKEEIEVKIKDAIKQLPIAGGLDNVQSFLPKINL